MKKYARYGCGGKVVKSYQDGGPVKKSKKKSEKTPEPEPEMLGDGMAAKAAETLRDKRKKQMEDLGLRDGGRAKRKRY